MITVVDNLRVKVEQLKGDLRCLLDVHAAIHHEPGKEFGGHVEETPWGRRRTGGGYSMGYSAWMPLSAEGVQVQAAALDKYRHFEAISRVLSSLTRPR